MRKFLVSSLLATLALAPGAARAADLNMPAIPQFNAAEIYAADTRMDWSGFYAGFNAGYGFGHEDPVDLQAFPDRDPLTVGGVTAEGWLGGVQAGYNVQSGNLVFGLEADVQGTDYGGSGVATVDGVTANATTEVGWFGTVRPRIGYAMGDALIYATGGLAFGGLDATIDATGILGYNGTIATLDELAWGYAVGAGAEYAITDQISIKSEYQFVQLRADATGTLLDASGVDTGVVGSSRVRSNMHAVKVGLNFHF
ncbi:outer membrane protein [Devosia sp. FKR38]|uniref:outer membrane protein n=1 Tax=Devosia sp. FKR38 TaxID=2562312 RepID=UPI0014856034|nr:outer membrane protein [Devosia sp. FKR38]